MPLTDCYNIDNLFEELKSIQSRKAIYLNRKELLNKNLASYQEDVSSLEDRLKLIESAKQYFLKVVDLCYVSSIKEMEDFVNHVLAYVFYDESYKIELDISNKHNKSITFYLIDEIRELKLPLRKGNGKGVKAVVSFILLTYYLMRMKSKYLFLDESFVNISSGYVERFFEYVKLLCHKYEMCVVLITHDVRFLDFADKTYQVCKGVVTEK